jgi:two-component system, NtrC family, sensor kinase
MPMRADRNLCELSELFEQIFSITPLPLLMLGEDGTLLGASDEARDSHDEGDEPLRERAAQYVLLLRGTVPWLVPQVVDSVRTSASGAVVYERIHVRRASWGACLTIVDQTDLRRLQTVDVQNARLAALGFMVAGVCHEVTNPLTSLHSIVQILRSEKSVGQELLDKGLDNIAVNVKRILDISRRLVKFSRVGDEPHACFAADDAIEEALSVLRQDGSLRDIELCHRADPGAVVFGHGGQVREILLNLFVNAVQAMDGKGQLRIATRRCGRMLEVLIDDSGPGVRADAMARIFEPFFTTKSSMHGTGLGLPISNEIAHEHGGSIELRHSSAQGASFCVTLPTEPP